MRPYRCRTRVDKGITLLEDMVREFPLGNPQVSKQAQFLLLRCVACMYAAASAADTAQASAVATLLLLIPCIEACLSALFSAPAAWLTRAIPCLTSPQDERLQELMDGMRGRFKALTAMMGLQVGQAAGWGAYASACCSEGLQRPEYCWAEPGSPSIQGKRVSPALCLLCAARVRAARRAAAAGAASGGAGRRRGAGWAE